MVATMMSNAPDEGVRMLILGVIRSDGKDRVGTLQELYYPVSESLSVLMRRMVCISVYLLRAGTGYTGMISIRMFTDPLLF
jgi:hypothetical protein